MTVAADTARLHFTTSSAHRKHSHLASPPTASPTRRRFTAPAFDDGAGASPQRDGRQDSDEQTQLVKVEDGVIDLYGADDKIVIPDVSLIELSNTRTAILARQSHLHSAFTQLTIDTNAQFSASIDDKLVPLHSIIQSLHDLRTLSPPPSASSLHTTTVALVRQHNTAAASNLQHVQLAIDSTSGAHLKKQADWLAAANAAERTRQQQAAEQARADAADRQRAEQDRLRQEADRQRDSAASQQPVAQQQQEDPGSGPKDTSQPINASAAPSQSATAAPAVQSPAVAEADECMQMMQQIQQVAAQYQQPDRLQIKGTITRTINQLSGTVQQVRSKTQILIQLVRSCAPGEDAKLAYVVNEVCQRVVAQGRSRIARHAATAYAVAVVAVQLSLLDSRFKSVLLGYMYTACRYTIPQFLSSKQYASKHEYMLALGYELLDNDDDTNIQQQQQFEPEEQYFDRVSGYVCLYAAYVQIPAPTHPYGIQHGWTYVSRLVNRKPSAITGLLLYSFLSTAAYTMYSYWPEQTVKLVELITTHIVPQLASNSEPRKAAKQRLVNWLANTMDQIRQNGKPDEPEGRSLPAGQESDTSIQQATAADHNAI